MPARLASALLVLALTVALSGSLVATASGEPAWTTYHRDAVRSGDDPDASLPIAPTLAWHSQDLGAPIWSQPLILGSRVYVATVGDKVFALDAASGAIVWQRAWARPCPRRRCRAADVKPTVGIVGTPVIDPAAQVIYAVADVWDGSNAHHELIGLNLANGAETLRTRGGPAGRRPEGDPSTHRAEPRRRARDLRLRRQRRGLQRLQSARWSPPRRAAPAPLLLAGAGSLPSKSGGAVWATGGPAVGPEGDVYATTGNPARRRQTDRMTTPTASSQLSPAAGHGLASSRPNWRRTANRPRPVLRRPRAAARRAAVPGRQGRHRLPDRRGDDGRHGCRRPCLRGQACAGRGSFGGDSFAGGRHLYPLHERRAGARLQPGRAQLHAAVAGPRRRLRPADRLRGLVWDVASGGFSGGGTKLYGLDPASGTARYTLTLPSPVADHFASPSAAGGRLFLATGSTATAYTISANAVGGSPARSCPSPFQPPAKRSRDCRRCCIQSSMRTGAGACASRCAAR